MDWGTILIACQEGGETESLNAFFQDRHYRVETAKTLGEMIRKVRDDSIHVLLLDDEIEGVRGWELVPLLKRIRKSIQVIVISSEESIAGVRRLRGTGIFYQAMKPVDLDELESAVVSALEKVRRERIREGAFSLLMPTAVMTLCTS